MKLSVKFAKEAILNKNGLNHLQIEVTPPKLNKVKEKPVLMVIVLDRSNSMGLCADFNSLSYPYRMTNNNIEQSSKMDRAISATIKFLTLLKETDLFGVVSFDSIAFIDQPLVHVSSQNIHQIAYNIRQITPRGTTNISDALKKVKEMIKPEHKDKYNCKIILLSDGQANEGVTSIEGLNEIAKNFLQEGITVTSLGIGLDYNSTIMNGLAVNGGGLFYHIEDLSLLEDIFEEELALSTKIIAKNVKVRINIPDLIEIGENLNGYAQELNKDYIEVSMGDLFASRKILFEIRNNFVNENVEFNISVSYKSLEGKTYTLKTSAPLKVVETKEELAKAKENSDVVKLVLALIKNRTIVRASEFLEKGDFASMQNTFTDSSASIFQLSNSYTVSDAETNKIVQELNEVSSIYSSGTSANSSYTKSLYARSAYNIRSQ